MFMEYNRRYVKPNVDSIFSLIPESARWLLSHDREDEAKEILYKTARYNGKAQNSQLIQNLTHVHVKKGSFAGLFKRYKLAKITLCLWLVW